jgi:hypothetical protein
MPEGKTKAKWLHLHLAPKETNHDLLILPHPDLINRDEETYVITGPSNLKVQSRRTIGIPCGSTLKR